MTNKEIYLALVLIRRGMPKQKNTLSSRFYVDPSENINDWYANHTNILRINEY